MVSYLLLWSQWSSVWVFLLWTLAILTGSEPWLEPQKFICLTSALPSRAGSFLAPLAVDRSLVFHCSCKHYHLTNTASGTCFLRRHSGKEPPANAGDTRKPGLIPGSGRFSGKEMVTHSSILARKIQRTEKTGVLKSMGVRKSQEATHASAFPLGWLF